MEKNPYIAPINLRTKARVTIKVKLLVLLRIKASKERFLINNTNKININKFRNQQIRHSKHLLNSKTNNKRRKLQGFVEWRQLLKRRIFLSVSHKLSTKEKISRNSSVPTTDILLFDKLMEKKQAISISQRILRERTRWLF